MQSGWPLWASFIGVAERRQRAKFLAAALAAAGVEMGSAGAALGIKGREVLRGLSFDAGAAWHLAATAAVPAAALLWLGVSALSVQLPGLYALS